MNFKDKKKYKTMEQSIDFIVGVMDIFVKEVDALAIRIKALETKLEENKTIWTP